MKLTIYSDYHLLIPMALEDDLPKSYDEVIAQNAYYLGDNVDKRGSGDRTSSDKLIAHYKAIFKERFISGNHEGLTSDLDIKIGNVLLTHGDLPLEGEEVSLARRAKDTVTHFGWLQSMVAWLRAIIPYVLSSSKKDALEAYARKFGCNVIVFGHTHTPKIIDIKYYKGVRIINVPRGKTLIEV